MDNGYFNDNDIEANDDYYTQETGVSYNEDDTGADDDDDDDTDDDGNDDGSHNNYTD